MFFRVKCPELIAKAEAALRYIPEAAPCGVRYIKYFSKYALGSLVAFLFNYSAILDLYRRPAVLYLFQQHCNALQHVERFESGNNSRDSIFF